MNINLGAAQKSDPVPTGSATVPVSSSLGSLAPGTLVAPSKAVLPTGSASAADNPAQRPAVPGSTRDTTAHVVTIDPDTHQLVQQTVDTWTHAVVDQLPDKFTLGLRAYFDRLSENSASASASGSETDHARVERIV